MPFCRVRLAPHKSVFPSRLQGLRSGALRTARSLSSSLAAHATAVRDTQNETLAPLCTRVMAQHQLLGSMHETIAASLERQQNDNSELRTQLREVRQQLRDAERERDALQETLVREREESAGAAVVSAAQATELAEARGKLQEQVSPSRPRRWGRPAARP